MAVRHGFGIDVGGSGIKGSVVDLDSGQLDEERLKIATPHPAKPNAVADVVAEIVRKFGWEGPVGITLPSVVKSGIALTAANIDKEWVYADASALFAKRLNRSHHDVVVLNDADAAGLAEINYGSERLRCGVVLLLTFGTGIGSALFLDGKLVPNTELGHVEVDGHDGEKRAAASVKEERGLSWEEWAEQVTRYLQTVENLIWPDLIVVGGGVSRKADKWIPLLDIRTTVVAAELKNNAGIVGAATAAAYGIGH